MLGKPYVTKTTDAMRRAMSFSRSSSFLSSEGKGEDEPPLATPSLPLKAISLQTKEDRRPDEGGREPTAQQTHGYRTTTDPSDKRESGQTFSNL